MEKKDKIINSFNPNITNPMQSSIDIEHINNGKIKKIFTKNEVEDIEKCLISMSEDGTGRMDFSSNYSEHRPGHYNNNVSDIDSGGKSKNMNNNVNYQTQITEDSNKKNNNIQSLLNLKKEIFKTNNNFENNPNLIFLKNSKNLVNNNNVNSIINSNKFKNLKSKSELKMRVSSKNSHKSKNYKSGGNNISNIINRNTPTFKGQSKQNKNNNYYINIDNQSGCESICSNYNLAGNQNEYNAAIDSLKALPNKIFIDSQEYNKLKYKPQSDIKIDEMICMRVYEKIEYLSSQLSELRRNYNSVREMKLHLEEENSFLKLEKEKLVKTKDYQIETLNETLSKTDLELKKILDINNKQNKKIDEYTPKVFNYDDLNEKYLKLIKENQIMAESQKSINDILQNLKKEKDEIIAKMDILKIESEAIKNDKFFLARENTGLSEKNKDLIDKIKLLDEEIRQIKKTNNDYIEKLTNKNVNIDNVYEEKLKNELFDMKKKYNEDMDNLKKLYDEISSKRCAYLQEERDDYKQKNIKLEKVIKDKEENLEFLNNELRGINKKTDEEISYLKIQLKIKSEELDRITNIYEENTNLMKLFKAENESLKDKVDVLRTELILKETSFKEELSEYKAQMISLKEKVANYEHIENELDKVIVESAYNNSEKDSELLGIIKDIPTTSKRRISQCLILANKLKLAAVENEKLKDLIKKLEKDLHASNEEKELYKNVSDKAKQPYAYIIKNMQDLELELFRKNNEIADKEKSIKSLLRENDLLNEKICAMEIDLKAIISNRQKLDYLEEMILKFMGNNDEKGLIDNINNYMYNNFSVKNKDFNLMKSNNNVNNMMSTNNTNYNSTSLKSHPNYYLNNSSTYNVPERDIGMSSNSNYNQQMNKVPLWYQNLKAKKQI